MATATAVYPIQVDEAGKMRVPSGMTVIPTGSCWMASTPTRIKIFSPDLKVVFNKRIKQNRRLVYSERGKHFGITKYNDHSPTSFSLLRLDVFSNTGKLLWSIKKPRASSFVLSDKTPRAIGIVGAEGFAKSELDIYTDLGKLDKTLTVTYLLDVRFSPNGECLFVNSADAGLMLYDRTGNLIQNLGTAEKYCMSENSSYVALVNSEGILQFKNGVKINSIPMAFDDSNSVVDMKFDPSLSRLALLCKNSLRIYRLPTLELIWDEKNQQDNRKFTSLACSDNGLLAIGYDVSSEQNGEINHTEGGVSLFDWDGSLLWSKKFSYSNWSRDFPMVRFASDGNAIQIATRNEAYLFSIFQQH